MKVIKAKVQWNAQYMNDPQLMVLLGDMPKDQAKRWVQKGHTYYCEQDGLVDMFYYASPGEGYGGRRFPIKMLSGANVILTGPWSSRCGAMNMLAMSEYYNSCLKEPQKAYPCSEVVYFTSHETYERGYTGFAGAITLPYLLEAANLAEVHLIVKWQPRAGLADLSSEQMDAVRCGDQKYHAGWEQWTELPIGTDFNFCPSLNQKEIIKVLDEGTDLTTYRR